VAFKTRTTTFKCSIFNHNSFWLKIKVYINKNLVDSELAEHADICWGIHLIELISFDNFGPRKQAQKFQKIGIAFLTFLAIWES
jgi:hypothetical protein